MSELDKIYIYKAVKSSKGLFIPTRQLDGHQYYRINVSHPILQWNFQKFFQGGKAAPNSAALPMASSPFIGYPPLNHHVYAYPPQYGCPSSSRNISLPDSQPIPDSQLIPGSQPVHGFQPIPGSQSMPGFQPVHGFQPMPFSQPTPGSQPMPGSKPVSGFKPVRGSKPVHTEATSFDSEFDSDHEP